LMTVNSPIEIAGQQKIRPRRAPKVGEHSDAVLRDAGYADTEIAALREAGVIA
jgi:crotonobetainyl-CoA:carnitine CoA-transferase CaiB-like acyl-CoA transferase